MIQLEDANEDADASQKHLKERSNADADESQKHLKELSDADANADANVKILNFNKMFKCFIKIINHNKDYP